MLPNTSRDGGAIDLDAGRFLQGDGGLDRDAIARLDRLQRERGGGASQQRRALAAALQKPWSQIRHCQSP